MKFGMVLVAVLGVCAPGQELRFEGRAVRITTPETDEDGFFPKGPASVCVEGPPRRQCYKAPGDFGRVPKAEVVWLDRKTPALFFSAASGGVSGFRIHFALLRPGSDTELEDLFGSNPAVSSQSQQAFWSEPAISAAKIFVTADFVWGRDEGHHSEHRYIISAYVRQYSHDRGGAGYYLEDRYMTAKKYESWDKSDILGEERREILARLRRLKNSPKK